MIRSTPPRLSILIPTRDEAAWLEAMLPAVRAAAKRSGLSCEVIVCDAHSTDDTRAVAARLADAVITHAPPRAAQLNAGLREATGDIIVLLHADTLITDATLSEIDRAIARGCVGGWAQVRLLPEGVATPAPTLNALPLVAASINLRTRLFTTATGDQCLFASADTLRAMGGVPAMPMMEGWALARALRDAGRVAVLAPLVTISARRWERGGVLATSLEMLVIRGAFAAGVPVSWLRAVWERAR